MNIRKLFFFLLFLGLMFKPFITYAQVCRIIPATITTMAEPQIGSYNLWDVLHATPERGKANVEFVSTHRDDRGWISIGTYRPSDTGQTHLHVTRVDGRGREAWRKTTPVAGLSSIKKVVEHGAGYVVLGAEKSTVKAPATIWIGFVNKAGGLISSKTIKAQKGDLIADDIIALTDGKTLIMSSHVKLPNGQQFTQMYKLSAKGTPLMQRYYRFGTNNQIEALAVAHNGGIMAVGNNGDSIGRPTGWALRLDQDLKIAWQKTYPRGFGSSLKSALAVDENSWVAGGNVTPSDGGTSGAWVIQFGANGGDVSWERYFRGDRNYDVAGLTAASSGLMSVILAGSGLEKSPDQPESYDFVRLLTLSPRGNVTGSTDYLNAHGVYVNKLITGANEQRLLVGSTIDKDGTSNGWLIATPGTGVYNDPCK